MSGSSGKTSRARPQEVRRSYASAFKESEALFHSYEHLQGLERGDAALLMLRKIASLVKPIMRKRGWKVQILAEFLPSEYNLLGVNINQGFKICLRLRYHHNPTLFLPQEQVLDTMLHELSHNVWGQHDSNFHALWDELRSEHETLAMKGYTGEGFLSAGRRVGGSHGGIPPPHEMRRLARASAEKRRAQDSLSKGSGRRLGGAPLHVQGGDVRKVIADQVVRRNTIDKGCASGREDAASLSDQSANRSFKTQAEEDDANNRAIAQALFELMEQEEERKLNGTFQASPTHGGLSWTPEFGLYDSTKGQASQSTDSGHGLLSPLSEDEQMKWALRDSMRGTATENHESPIVSPLTPSDQSRPAPPIPSHSKPSAAVPPPVHAATRPASSPPQPTRQQAWNAARGPEPTDHRPSRTPHTPRSPGNQLIDISEPFNPDEWSCALCTCINPMQFLACDACGSERPQPGPAAPAPIARARSTGAMPRGPTTANVPQPQPQPQPRSWGWNCGRCHAFMEDVWWTCSACGTMKTSS